MRDGGVPLKHVIASPLSLSRSQLATISSDRNESIKRLCVLEDISSLINYTRPFRILLFNENPYFCHLLYLKCVQLQAYKNVRTRLPRNRSHFCSSSLSYVES